MINHLITICARGGSKGIPGKNILPLNGKPLIAYTIEIAFQLASVLKADVGLSTDSDEIHNVAAEFGLHESYKRPAELGGDTIGKISVIKELMIYYEEKNDKNYDYVWDLDVSSPLRNKDDLMQAFHLLVARPDALNIFSVSKASKNPYFNMVEETDDGFAKLVKNFGEIKARQKAPNVYDMNASFYIFRKEFFEKGWDTSTTDRSLCYIMPHICFDIDHPLDFKILELMFRENLLDFEL